MHGDRGAGDPQRYLEGLQGLIRASERLVAAADAADWDLLLAALEDRQTIMAELDQLTAVHQRLSQPQQAVARRLLERMASLDQDVTKKVAVALTTIRSEMDGNKLAQTTVSAYRKALNPSAQAYPAKFVDKQR